MIDLYTPSGIGDIYWILQKLARAANATGEKFRIHTPPGSGAKFERGKFLEYIDCVESVKPDGIPYDELVQCAQQYTELQSVMHCEANTWLESGQRLEQYMPAFETEFVLNWQIEAREILKASTFCDFSKKNIVVYTSGVKNNDSSSTGRWSHKEWISRIDSLRSLENVRLIWIGADYDTDILTPQLKSRFDAVLIDEPASVVLSLLRMCDGFISYQSGLSCISVVESIPTLMLYFRKIEALAHTFNPPSGEYKAVFFDDLPSVHEWAYALPLRLMRWRDKHKDDYTEWVNENVEKTEADWQKAQWIHEDQFESIKHLRGSILEVGCGSGWLAKRITEDYTGVDKSRELIDLARAKNQTRRFIVEDVRDLDTDKRDHVCAFGFMKHIALKEWPFVFYTLARHAEKTLTIETPIFEVPAEDRRHEFPHTFASRDMVYETATRNGFSIVKETLNRSGEFIFHMVRT